MTKEKKKLGKKKRQGTSTWSGRSVEGGRNMRSQCHHSLDWTRSTSTVIQQPGLLQRPAVPHSRSSLRPNNGALKVAWMVIPIMLGRMWRRPRKCFFFPCPVLENTTPNKKRGKGQSNAEQRER